MKKIVIKASDISSLNFINDKKDSVYARYARKSLAISDYIENFIASRNYKQKDIADQLEMYESQISKWLSGAHNLTLKSILKLESASTIQLLNPAIFDNPKKSELESTTYSFTPNFLKENLVNDKTMGKVITMPTSTAPVSLNAKVADYAL